MYILSVKNRAADPNEISSLGVRAGNSQAISSALELKLIRTAFNLKTKNNSFIMLVYNVSFYNQPWKQNLL